MRVETSRFSDELDEWVEMEKEPKIEENPEITIDVEWVRQQISNIRNHHRQWNKSSQKVRIDSQIKGLWRDKTQDIDWNHVEHKSKISFIALFQSELNNKTFAQSHLSSDEDKLKANTIRNFMNIIK